MGSAGPDDSSQKAIEPDLIDVGKRLLRRPSSTEKLLILLEKAERLLAKVWQQPPQSTCKALLPAMKALITDEILRHDDVNVQVAVASCFNELTRITAPDFTYSDDTMRVIFQLFMIAFKQLSCESGRNYYRALQIVETMAKVRSSLMLLDIDTGGLVIEMFQLFLNNIRSNHPSDVFKYMEMIMTLVIEESDEVSFELLRPLLASVKMANKDTSPISWELGKKVFENCATKLQCYLREAVKAMNLEFDDYAEIVACICRDTSSEKNAVSMEVTPGVGDGASQLDGLPKAVHENCTPQTKDGTATNLSDENSLETLKDCHQIVQSGKDGGALRKKRGRKPNSVIRPEEGYEHTWKRGGRYSREASPEGYNEEIEDLALPSELGNLSMLSNSSQKRVDSFTEGSLHKRGQSKKKENMTNQHNDLEFSSTLKEKIRKLKERDHNAPKKTGKKAIAGLSKIRVEKEEGIHGDTSKEGRHELLRQEPYGRKELISQKHVQKDDADKMEDFPMFKPAKAKSQRKEEDKKSRRSRAGYGEELVNLRIQVWWPMDETFYAGTVKAFDSETKKHTILYDDDEIEILNLRKETWKLFSDKQPSQAGEADHSSPSREPTKIQEKKAKRKAVTMKKQHADSSSKRSKNENRIISKSGENYSPGSVHIVGRSDDETDETNVSTKNDGGNEAGKEKSEMLKKKTESDHIPEDVKKG